MAKIGNLCNYASPLKGGGLVEVDKRANDHSRASEKGPHLMVDGDVSNVGTGASVTVCVNNNGGGCSDNEHSVKDGKESPHALSQNEV